VRLEAPWKMHGASPAGSPNATEPGGAAQVLQGLGGVVGADHEVVAPAEVGVAHRDRDGVAVAAGQGVGVGEVGVPAGVDPAGEQLVDLGLVVVVVGHGDREALGGEPVAERGPDVADRLVVNDGADPVRRLRLTRNGTRWSWRRGAFLDRVSAPTLWVGNGSGRRITRPGPSRSCFPMTRGSPCTTNGGRSANRGRWIRCVPVAAEAVRKDAGVAELSERLREVLGTYCVEMSGLRALGSDVARGVHPWFVQEFAAALRSGTVTTAVWSELTHVDYGEDEWDFLAEDLREVWEAVAPGEPFSG